MSAGRQARPSGALPPPAPKLVVLIMVDQMRGDYVDKFKADWTGGLKRLVSEGAWFHRAAYPYLNTVTCVGHSTVATGAYPHRTGIISNSWLDRGANTLTACTTDATAHDVAYSRDAAGGDSARLLQISTLADEMRRQKSAHVVSLSLKADAAIMMAGHAGDAVTWLDIPTSTWTTSSAYTNGPVSAVKVFTDANPVDADYGKTWTRMLPESRYQGTDDGEAEAPPNGWTRTFPHELKSNTGKPDNDFHVQWQRSPFADEYLGRFAAALVESMKLGRNDGTDVLAVSFSSPDLVGHAFGPRSQEVQDIYAHLDRTVGVLLDRLDALVGRDKYFVGLCADHGVTELPEQLKKEGKDAGRIDAVTVAAIIDTRAKALAGGEHYVQRLVGNDVYFERGMYEKLQEAPGAMKAAVDALQASQGIARVFRREELTAAGATASTDRVLRAAALSYFPGRSGDLVLALKPGWMFAAIGTTHGTANEEDQHVPILLMGPGVKAGVYEQPAAPADVAPTLARLAGISLASAEGRVLKEALAAKTTRSSGQ
jgi:predicted AlkP superfamily pyrophosphatase or phosphodiesterase